MNITAQNTLRPGLLVALKTSVTGNRMTNTTILELTETVRHTDTVSTLEDPKEHQRALQTRGRVRSIIRSVCAQTAYGYLCPLERREKLTVALAEAQKLVADFNASAKLSNVWFGVMVGEVAANDFQAVRAINEEVRSLINEMGSNLTSGDVLAARDAARRAQEVAEMLAADAQALVDEAVKSARAAATAITKAAKNKTPETDFAAKDAIAVATFVLTQKRTAFLDFDVEAVPVANNGSARSQLDLGA